jgi:CBS domain-containing protein
MPHFSFLPESERRKIAKAAIEKTYPEGRQYAQQGETNIDSIFIVRKGSLALFDERKGLEKATGYIKPGEVFGGITILLNAGVSLRTVVVDEDCSGYLVPKAIFLDLCTRFKSFYEYFLENFSKHIFDESLTTIIETGQAKHFLSRVDPFSFLPEDEIEKVASELSMVQYPKGTVLFVQSRTRIGYLYILQSGSAERYLEEKNQKTMVEMLGEGDIYGGISILVNDGISVRTLRVLERSYFYLLPKGRFLDLCSHYEEFTEYFTDTFGRRMLQKSYAAVVAQTVQSQQEELQFFNQPVSSLYSRKPIFGDPEMSIRSAGDLMERKKISSIFLKNKSGKCVGVVTERDLARKVVAAGYDVERSVSEIMSSPVRSIPSQSLIFEALLTMMEEDMRHLAVTDANESVIGILSNRDLLTAQGQGPVFLLREISDAGSMDEIIEGRKRLPMLIRNLIASGAKSENITRFITTISDAILKKIMAYTLEELGPPPAKFVFMIMGSEGRHEQTLKTDQDNAIVFEDVPESSADSVRDYFLKFGEKACTLLDQAGYDFCEGGVMAQNPKWCQPLATWKEYFNSWIHTAEAEDLLQASIFFDFRAGYGDGSIIEELRRYLFDSLEGWSGFFRHLTENALHFKPPLGFFGGFVVESKGEHRSALDIKSAMTPIVDFARVYALKNRVEETNTMERLRHLRLKKVLTQQEFEELEKAYGFMMQLRFVRQVNAVIDEKTKPTNYLKPKKLTNIEQKMLKEIFKRVEKFQSKMEFDFTGII